MEVKTKYLNCSVIDTTFDAVKKLAKRQNSAFGNVVDRLLREGVEETYRKWPNLKDKP